MAENLLTGFAFGLFVFIVGASALAVFNFFRLKTLERKYGELEDEVAFLERAAGSDRGRTLDRPDRERPQAEKAETTPPPTPAVVKGEPLFEPLPEGRSFDLEALIAGEWLHRIGILAILLATSFFLKYAFDNDWIGPTGRVVIGLVAGTGLLAGSQWFSSRGHRVFSDGIAALGGGVLFLSLYAAWDFYELIPQAAAFGGMILVTASLAGLARGRGSQRLAVLALLGGLLTPGLLSTGVDNQTTLFVYLLALTAGFLALAWTMRWRWLAPIALAGFVVYFFSWYDEFYEPAKLLPTLLFGTLFFLSFGALGALRARQDAPLHLDETCLVLANAYWFGLGLHLMLYDDHRWWLTIAVLVLAVVYLLLTRASSASATRYVFAGVALAFATAAIPIRLQGEWIRTALAVEGAALVWAGFRSGIRALRWTGLALIAVVVVLLFDASGDTERFLLNERFLAFVAAVAALAASAYWGTSDRARIGPDERRIFEIAGIAANAVAVWGLSEEVWRVLGTASGSLDPKLARQLGLSLLWTICGGVLIGLGVGRREPALRWQGLLLIGLAVAKVFLFDLSFLDKGYRIVSFVVLGVVLLALSFFYQRGLSADRKSNEP
ncbi:MAG: DUF2339 domain-containing protein [bacterium]|nr:DUF2339 domain-containing protein [bacterium]